MDKKAPDIHSPVTAKRRYQDAFNDDATNNIEETTLDQPNLNVYTSPLHSRGEPDESQNAAWDKTNFSRNRPFPVTLDPDLPEDIVAQHLTYKCLVCDVLLTSEIMAKSHYLGKPHAKMIKKILEQRKEASTGTQVANKKKKKTTDGSQLYCKCCDLSFTSSEHATQHYLGRNHQRVLHGMKPLKTGYFNPENGKWQRLPMDPAISAEQLEKNTNQDSVKGRGKFFCDLCGVSATSQDQLNGHLEGQKHTKAVQMNAQKTSKTGKTDSILTSVMKHSDSSKPKKDFSIHRTPSGKYYCSTCDVTLNSEHQFAQHLESKKHILGKK